MQFQSQDASPKSKALVEAIIEKTAQISKLSKPRKKFIVSIIVLFLSLRGRYTFSQLARYGQYSQKTYRLHFEQAVDFASFNTSLISSHTSSHRIVVFDPSFIPKSGKHTPHCGKFWSGCAARAEWGLELGALAIVDVERRTAFHLEAVQTPNRAAREQKGQNLLEHYTGVVTQQADKLRSLSKYVVVDAYFSKTSFLEAVTAEGLHVVGKLRKDAHLKYLYTGVRKRGRGRPRQFDGKIDWQNPDLSRFELCAQTTTYRVYQLVAWSVSFKRNIKIIYKQKLNDGKAVLNKKTNQIQYELLFSTDTNLAGKTLISYYQLRFQIEFLLRDAKQFTGLTQCQARSQNKLYFHWNTALTAINIAKIAHAPPNQPFSMASIKTLYLNELMLSLFFSNFHINPDLNKNKASTHKLLNFGIIAA